MRAIFTMFAEDVGLLPNRLFTRTLYERWIPRPETFPADGQYSNEKLINIGSNRWAFKPEIGLSHPMGKWTLEAAAGVWLFADYNAAYPGAVERSQGPLASFQGHVGFTVRPGLWIAADATYYIGGRTYADDVPGNTRQSNSRAGLTASVPFARTHSVKVSISTGVSTRVGTRFDSYGIAYQFLWFD